MCEFFLCKYILSLKLNLTDMFNCNTVKPEFWDYSIILSSYRDNKDMCTSSPSKTFRDFEKEWIDTGKSFDLVFDTG